MKNCFPTHKKLWRGVTHAWNKGLGDTTRYPGKSCLPEKEGPKSPPSLMLLLPVHMDRNALSSREAIITYLV